MIAWCAQANAEFGAVNIGTLGKDWPFVAGNLGAILGGLLIAWGGSLAFPDKTFKWEMLNERIPLVDDIEPAKDEEETDERLQKQVKIAVGASLFLTFVLIIAWPIPMHLTVGVFSKGRFTTWVVVEMMWAIIGGIVIIVLPVYETVRDVLRTKKQHEEAVEQRKLKNGMVLSVDFGTANEPLPVASKLNELTM